MRVLFAGGGTGGHVYPALAVAEAMRGAEMLFVGSKRGIEERIVRRAGLSYRGVPVEGFHRRPTVANLLFPFRLAWACAAAWRVVRGFRPEVVLGTGGFASGPPVFAAWLQGVPIVLQEQNAYPGVTTRILSRWAAELHLAFAEARDELPERVRDRARCTGNPVRVSLAADLQGAGDGADARRAARASIEGLDPERATLLVLGGSQGSRLLNVAVGRLLESEIDRLPPFQILWATGRKLYAEVIEQQLPASPAVPVVVRPYLEEMSTAYAAADLVLCRAGAITCAELALVGRSSVLVPLASAAGDHQSHNARALAGAGAARIVTEDRLLDPRTSGRVLAELLSELLGDRRALDEMASSARALARPEAAREIAGRLAAIAGEGDS